MTASHEVACFGSRDPLAFPRITGFCDRPGKPRDPQNRDHGYQSLCNPTFMGGRVSLYMIIINRKLGFEFLLLPGSFGFERQVILGAFDRLLEAMEQIIQVFISLHEVDFRGIDHQQVSGAIVKEEVVEGLDDFGQIIE